MPRTISTENPGLDVCRYLRHWGNPRFVESELSARHTGLTADQRRRKAKAIALSVLQGLEFLETAEEASLLTKPLPQFYAVENIAKALCLFNDPDLEVTDFRAHGLRGDKSKRYSIKNFQCNVAAPGSDVWSRVVRLANGDWIQFDLEEDGTGLTRSTRTAYATQPPAPGKALKLGELLRHLPELGHDVGVAGWGSPYSVPVVQFNLRLNAGPPRSNSLRFMLRHGHDQEVRSMIVNRETDLLRKYTRQQDTLDVIEYSIGPVPETISTPVVRCDIFGRLYFDFARGILVVSELVIYFASLFILSDVVRYQVDQWSRLLEDHPDEAILIERFLDLVRRKLPNLVLNELHRDVILFSIGS